MKQFKSFLFVFFILISSGLSAQLEDIDENIKAMELMRGSETIQKGQVLRQQQMQNSRNAIFINQVGAGNTVNAQLRASESATSSFQQNGDSNAINTTIIAKNIQNNINQNGINNQVIDYANAPNKDISLNLSQQGNDLYFERFGSNSIGDNLQFNMTGSFKSIIVRNFK